MDKATSMIIKVVRIIFCIIFFPIVLIYGLLYAALAAVEVIYYVADLVAEALKKLINSIY